MVSVIYQFKVKAGREKEFQDYWADVTAEFRDEHGGLGSCLHLTEEGIYLAYARWADKKTFEADKEFKNLTALNGMKDCVEERLEPIVMEIVNDMLVR